VAVIGRARAQIRKNFKLKYKSKRVLKKTHLASCCPLSYGHLSFFETVGEVESFDGFFNSVKDTFTTDYSAK